MVTGRSVATKRGVWTAVLLSSLVVLPRMASAEETPPAGVVPVAPVPVPRAHHAPVSTAPPGERLTLQASFDHPELIRSAVVVYQLPSGELASVPFLRGSGAEGYVAVIPGEVVKAPGLGYTIEVEQTNGTRISAFASRAAMHPVSVIEDRTDAREKASLKRLDGRRSVVSVSGEYVGFGKTAGSMAIPCADNQSKCKPGDLVIPSVDEQYYRAEASYTYRPLRVVSEFGFRLGIVRGRSLVPLAELDEEKYKVGLNFGAARIRFRILDAWQAEVELLTSITELGFSVGLGGSTLIGDPYGSKLVLGFESLGLGDSAPFGTRFFTRMDIAPNERWMISPIVEVTDMPHAEVFGVRLLGEVGLVIGRGFSAQLRGGYQARRSTSGGPGLGGSVSYSF